MNERKSPCVLQDIVPFRAAAQKRTEIRKKRNEERKKIYSETEKGGRGQEWKKERGRDMHACKSLNFALSVYLSVFYTF